MNVHYSLPEVTRYVVRIPMKSSIELPGLQAKLKGEFPNLSFRFERLEEPAQHCVVVVPVMEDTNGRAHICRVPDRSTLLRIHRLTRDAFFDAILE